MRDIATFNGHIRLSSLCRILFALLSSYALTTYLVTAPDPPSQTELNGIENIPSLDQCWLQCITVLRSFADGSIPAGPELAEAAVDRLQRCLLRQGKRVPSGVALLKCFDTVMMPLMMRYGSNDREKGYIIGIFVSTLLASSETLALQPGFSSFWLRVIDVLCKFVSQGGGLGETTTERLKNLLLVMIVEKRLETVSRVSEQDAMEATMTMLDSYCPAVRVDLEKMLRGDVPKERQNETEKESQRNEENQVSQENQENQENQVNQENQENQVSQVSQENQENQVSQENQKEDIQLSDHPDNQENENDTPTQVPQESQETLPTEPSNESAINNQSVSDTKTEELDVPLATDVIHVQDE